MAVRPFPANTNCLGLSESTDFGGIPLASARQDSGDCLSFADSRKISPKSMFRQPMENRKNADTSV